MNVRTIGCLELNSIAWGLHVADEMAKAAQVDLVVARPTCPGRYLVIVSGDVGSVHSAVDTGREIGGEMVVDWFVLPNLHPDVLPALSGTALRSSINALGVIETATTASCIPGRRRRRQGLPRSSCWKSASPPAWAAKAL